jgi:DNA-binding MarR family transcriptional regulator
MPAAAQQDTAQLAALLRGPLLRVTRLIRLQRVDVSVTLAQVSALAALERVGPMSAGELAVFERVQPPSMTKVLANLEERGFLRRDPHPTDKRQAVIGLTDAGRAFLESERTSRTAWLATRLEALAPHERAALYAVIPLLDKLAAP